MYDLEMSSAINSKGCFSEKELEELKKSYLEVTKKLINEYIEKDNSGNHNKACTKFNAIILCKRLFQQNESSSPSYGGGKTEKDASVVLLKQIDNLWSNPETRCFVKENLFAQLCQSYSEETYLWRSGIANVSFASYMEVPEICAWVYAKGQEKIGIHLHQLNQLSAAQLGALWEALSGSRIYSLGLIDNSLEKLTDDAWKAFCQGLSTTQNIRYLNLRNNRLYALTSDRLGCLWEAVRLSGVISLNIGGNYSLPKFIRRDKEKWGVFREGLEKSQLVTLRLRESAFGMLTTKECQELMAAIKASEIKELNLTDNLLNRFTTEKWAVFCEGLGQSTVQSLILTANSLGEMQVSWADFWTEIAKSNIVSLDLSFNGLNFATSEFSTESNEQWEAFRDGLSKSGVTQLTVRYNSLSAGQHDQLREILHKNWKIRYGLGEHGLRNLCRFMIFQTMREQLKEENNINIVCDHEIGMYGSVGCDLIVGPKS